MCVVNKQFELLEFVFDSVYVDQQYDEISLTFTTGSVSLCCVCGLAERLSWYSLSEVLWKLIIIVFILFVLYFCFYNVYLL